MKQRINSLSVNTPHGTIIAERCNEPDYPGFWISFKPYCKKNVMNYVKVEEDVNANTLQVLAWPNACDDDPESIKLEEVDKVNDCEDNYADRFSACTLDGSYALSQALLFFRPTLPCHILDDQTLKLLEYFDAAYGNTDQDLADWAPEYQMISRMLLYEKAVIINPKRLQVDIDFFRESNIFTKSQLREIAEALELSDEEKREIILRRLNKETV